MKFVARVLSEEDGGELVTTYAIVIDRLSMIHKLYAATERYAIFSPARAVFHKNDTKRGRGKRRTSPSRRTQPSNGTAERSHNILFKYMLYYAVDSPACSCRPASPTAPLACALRTGTSTAAPTPARG